MSSILLVSLSIMLCASVIILADDSPGFFLKVSKNVPRLGRRSDKQFESYFFKNAKQIPRIGRRNDMENNMAQDSLHLSSWTNDINSVNKRFLINPLLTTGRREYSLVQPVNANTLIELIDKNAIPSDDVKFVHWKDFDRALQTDNDLFTKVVSLGRRPDRQLKEDLSFSRFIPFFGNQKDDNDLIYYRSEKEMYPARENDILHYNNL